MRLLVVNPGGTGTKLALVVDDSQEHAANLEHAPEELAGFGRSVEQLDFRLKSLERRLDAWGVDRASLDAVVGRGGPLGPLRAGTYRVNAAMREDILEGRVSTDHPSLLGALMAYGIAEPLGLPAFVVDPVSVDELADVARLSGLKNLPRRSLWHALNSRHAARLACRERGLGYLESKVVVAHLGSGISVSAHVNGRAVDVSNPNDSGPFSPQRAGELPTSGLVNLCFSENADKSSIFKMLHRVGGLVDHTGTQDLREVESRMDAGDDACRLAWKTMAYQVAKQIGAMAVACGGCDLIVLTGGLAKSPRFAHEVKKLVSFLSQVIVLAGEMEMDALAQGAARVLRKEEAAGEYTPFESRR